VDNHLLDLLRATKQRIKNIIPKIVRMNRESNGKGCPRMDDRKHRHACVNGDRKRTMLNASGTWFKEKKVPLRKAIGRTTKLINKVIS
jgi:hypothetical protein